MLQARSQATAASSRSSLEQPHDVRSITLADVQDALRRGVDDFRAMPRHLIFLGIIYPVLSLLVVRFSFDYSVLPLLFPIVAGFALLGPFVAIGLYELSRRRELGLDTGWTRMLGVARSPSARPILTLGLGLMAVFVCWLLVALVIYRLTFGEVAMESPQFRNELFTTTHGWALILLGNGIGALFALAVFVTAVVSFPMLVDQRVRVGTAVGTSIKAVKANPMPMLAWAAIVVAGLILGSIPLFVGLAVVLPVLGHATWHLYRKVVIN